MDIVGGGSKFDGLFIIRLSNLSPLFVQRSMSDMEVE